MKEEKEINLIWARLASGDKAAFDALYNIYYNPIFAYCLGKIKNVELAENAAADVFIRVVQYDNLMEIKAPENWLFTVAKNICLNHLNKDNRRNRILNEISWKFENTTEQRSDQKLDMDFIMSKIKERLSEDDYKIWQLHEQGYDNSEISKKLEKKEKTIANRKVEIKKTLKDIVKIHMGIDGK